MEYEEIDVERDVPLEQVREVLAALTKHLGLSLYRYEWMGVGRDFEFRPKEKAPTHD